MSDFDHGLDLSHLTVWPPQPTTLAGVGLIALAIFQPELAIPALVAGLVAIIGDDKTHLNSKLPKQNNETDPNYFIGSSDDEGAGERLTVVSTRTGDGY